MVGGTELVCARQAAFLRGGDNPRLEQNLRKKERTGSSAAVSSPRSSSSCSISAVNVEESSGPSDAAPAAVAQPLACTHTPYTTQGGLVRFSPQRKHTRKAENEEEMIFDSASSGKTGRPTSTKSFQPDLCSSLSPPVSSANFSVAAAADFACVTRAAAVVSTAAATATVVPSAAASAAEETAESPAVSVASSAAGPAVTAAPAFALTAGAAPALAGTGAASATVQAATSAAASVASLIAEATESPAALGATGTAGSSPSSNGEANSSVPERRSCCSGVTQKCARRSKSSSRPNIQSENNNRGNRGGNSRSNSKRASYRGAERSGETHTTAASSHSKQRHSERHPLYKEDCAAKTYCSNKPDSSSSSKESWWCSSRGSTRVSSSDNATDSSTGNCRADCRNNTADRSSSSGNTGGTNSTEARSSDKCAVTITERDPSSGSTHNRGGNSRRSGGSRCCSVSQLLPQETKNRQEFYVAGAKRSRCEVVAAAGQEQQLLPTAPDCQPLAGAVSAAAATPATPTPTVMKSGAADSQAATTPVAAGSTAATPRAAPSAAAIAGTAHLGTGPAAAIRGAGTAAATSAASSTPSRKAAGSFAAARRPRPARRSIIAADSSGERGPGVLGTAVVGLGVAAGASRVAPGKAAAKTCNGGAALPATRCDACPLLHSSKMRCGRTKLAEFAAASPALSSNSCSGDAEPLRSSCNPVLATSSGQKFHRGNGPITAATREEGESHTAAAAAAAATTGAVATAVTTAAGTAAPTSTAAPAATALFCSKSFFHVTTADHACSHSAVPPETSSSLQPDPYATGRNSCTTVTDLPAAGAVSTTSEAVSTATTYPASAAVPATATACAAAATTAAALSRPPPSAASSSGTHASLSVAAPARRRSASAAARSAVGSQNTYAAAAGKVALASFSHMESQSVSSVSTSPSTCHCSTSDCLPSTCCSATLPPPPAYKKQHQEPVSVHTAAAAASASVAATLSASPAAAVSSVAAAVGASAGVAAAAPSAALASSSSAALSGTANHARAAASAVPEGATNTASARGAAASDSAAGGTGCLPASAPLCRCVATMRTPPPFPPLPLTCGVSPPAETVLLRDLQMLRLQRVLRTAAAQAAKGGQQQQSHASKTGQQQQHTAWERSIPQQDPAWLKNFSGWVLLQLPPSSAALARALATVKGPQHGDRGAARTDASAAASAGATAAAADERKGGVAVRGTGGVRARRRKARESGCGPARLRAASAAATAHTAAKGATAGGPAGRGAAAAAKRLAEEIDRKEGGVLHRGKQQQQAAKSQNGGGARHRRTRSSSSFFSFTGEASAAADTFLKVAGDTLLSPGGSHGVDASHPSNCCAKARSKDGNSSRRDSSVTSSRSVSSTYSSRYESGGSPAGALDPCRRKGRAGKEGRGGGAGGRGGDAGAAVAAETALSQLEAEVYMSRQTLLQTSGPRLSGFVDRSGKKIRVQRHVIEQILASAAPRFVFEQFYAQGVQLEPSLARYLEKRRIQSTLRRLKEHIELMLQEAATATGAPAEDFSVTFLRLARAAVTHCPSACSVAMHDRGPEAEATAAAGRVETGSNSPAAVELLHQVEIQQQGMCAALEALNWWAPGLNEQDKKEIFFAVATAGLQQQGRQRTREKGEKKTLPRTVDQQAWTNAFRFVPFNLPDWPVPSSAFPPPSETLPPLLPFLAAPSRDLLEDSSTSSSSSNGSNHAYQGNGSCHADRRNSSCHADKRNSSSHADRRNSSSRADGRDGSSRADSEDSSHRRDNSLWGRRSSSFCAGYFAGDNCARQRRSFVCGSSSAAAGSSDSTGSARREAPPGASVGLASSGEWTAAAGAPSSSCRAAACAPRCSRFFVVNKPQSILAAAAARRRRRLACCCCTCSVKQPCPSPLTTAAATATAASAERAGAATMAGRTAKGTATAGASIASRSHAAAESSTAEVPSATRDGDSQTPAPTAAGAPSKVSDVPQADANCVGYYRRSTWKETTGDGCMQHRSHSPPAACSTDNSTFSFARASHCCRLSPDTSLPSFPEPCLCGVLHLCRVALLICEAFCEPVSLRFPHFLRRLVSSDDASPSLSAAGKRRQISVEERALPRSSVAEFSAAHTTHALAGSSSSSCGFRPVATAAVTATSAGLQETRKHQPSMGAVAPSRGENTRAEQSRNPPDIHVDTDASSLGKCSSLVAQAAAPSQQQRVPNGRPEKRPVGGAAAAAADTPGSAVGKANGRMPAASNSRTKAESHLQHVETWNPLSSAETQPPLSSFSSLSSSVSSFSSSSHSSFSTAPAEEDLTTRKDDAFLAAVPPPPAVPSPYPPSPPLLYLAAHAAAEQQQRQLASAAPSKDASQTLRDWREMTGDTPGPQRRHQQSFSWHAVHGVPPPQLQRQPQHQQPHAQQQQQQILQHRQQLPAWHGSSHGQLLQQQRSEQDHQQQRRTPQLEQDQRTGSTAVPTQVMIPAWHLEQDFLLSRLVSLEELQGALRVLLPAGWVLAGLQLIIGAATAVLSPLEWLSLLHPCSSVASSVDLDDVVNRFNAQHSLNICSVGCSLLAAASLSSSRTESSLPHFARTGSHTASDSSSSFSVSLSPPSSSPRQSLSGADQGILPAVAALVSQQQRRAERECICYSEKKRLHEPAIETETNIHKTCSVTQHCEAASSTKENIENLTQEPTGSTYGDNDGPVARTVAGGGAHAAAVTTSLKREASGVPAADADAITNQQYTRDSCKHSTKQQLRERSNFLSAAGDCCHSRDVSRVHSRSGESRGVSSLTSQENSWAQTQDSRSRLGLHWWSFLSLDDKNKRRGDAREQRHMKKRDAPASRGQSLKESRPRGAASSTAKTRSHTSSRRGDTASDANIQEDALCSQSLGCTAEEQCSVTHESSVNETCSVSQKKEVFCMYNEQQSRSRASLCNRSRQQRTEVTDTRDYVRDCRIHKTQSDTSPVQQLEKNGAEREVATQASACVQLHVESLFASDKTRKAFEKLSAAALSSSVVELGMPAGGVDTLVSLVRTGGSCCLDLYAIIACCKLFFRIFKDAHVLQVLHDLI